MKSIGLCMIVRNESAVILSCLESVAPLIDYVLVEDTGSTDNTKDLIQDFLSRKKIPGEVYSRPWQDFATNRTSALRRLRERHDVDYALIMDADDVLTMAEGFDVQGFKRDMQADVYSLPIRLGEVAYARPQLCNNRLPFRYRGVLHEFLDAPEGARTEEVAGLRIQCGRGGARNRTPEKYKRDAETLERALQHEADPLLISRYTFYLAQSYRDSGEDAKALTFYLKRAELGFWGEERYISIYEAAKARGRLNFAPDQVVGLFLSAYELLPSRAEALHGAMEFCRRKDLFHQGYLIGKQAAEIKRPDAGLFIEEWIYQYGVLDELSILSYWTGRFRECRDLAQRLLNDGLIPDAYKERVSQNLRFAQEKI